MAHLSFLEKRALLKSTWMEIEKHFKSRKEAIDAWIAWNAKDDKEQRRNPNSIFQRYWELCNEALPKANNAA